MEIREALEAAVEEHNTPDPAPAQEPAQSAPAAAPATTADVAAASVPDEKPADKPAVKEKAPILSQESPDKPAVKEEAEKPVPETAEQRAQHRIDRAPASWKKEAKGDWATIPLHIRQEVYKREMEVERVLKDTAPIRQQMETINQTVAPYMARIQALGATPVQAIDSLLKADHILATAPRQQKAEYLAKLISDYDVDVSDLDAAIVQMMKDKTQQQPQQPQGFDPNYVNQLVKQQLEQALAPIYQERNAKQQAEQQQFQHTIESMMLDPKYPYFEDVRNDMADLIEIRAKRGIALSLEDAYDMAVRSNPDVYGQLSQQQSVAQANQQHLQAQRAKTAASSVTGAPAGGGSQSYSGDGSLRSQIEAAFNNSRI